MSRGSLAFRGGRPLRGAVEVPGDKSISHRALLLAALAEGTSTIHGLSDGDDVTRTAEAVAALGAEVEQGTTGWTVRGGRGRLAAPRGPLDLGNSGTGLRLLAGVVASLTGTTTLTGDDSLRRRPMDRIATPLERMGARVRGEGEDCRPPLVITGGELVGIDYTPPMASAQVKSAVLLAGLAASGTTVVREPVATRAHTERLLAAAGADVTVEAEGGGRVVRVRRSSLSPCTYDVPGDPSQAAFWLVAAAVVPGSRVSVPDIELSEERVGYLEVLRRMGARIEVRPSGSGSDGTVTSRSSALTGTVVEAAEIPSLDEVPILAVAAAVASGESRFRDVGELRVKESDRLGGTVALVRAFGGGAAVDGDELVVTGTGGHLVPAGRRRGGSPHGDGRGDRRGHVRPGARRDAGDRLGRGRDQLPGLRRRPRAPRRRAPMTDAPPSRDPAPGARRASPVIAIDGPAGSGKSTVAAALSDRLGIDRLDTGAMYRAVAWAALARGVDPSDRPAVAALARALVIRVGDRVEADGTDVTRAIRSREVSAAVSLVAANPEVRSVMVEHQRRWVAERGEAWSRGATSARSCCPMPTSSST